MVFHNVSKGIYLLLPTTLQRDIQDLAGRLTVTQLATFQDIQAYVYCSH